MTHTEWSVRYHEAEIISLRRQLRPTMILTPDERLIERRIADSESWLRRWKERASYAERWPTKVTLIAFVLTVLFCSHSAWAAFKTGNDLYNDCGNERSAAWVGCYGYIQAIADVFQAENKISGYIACLPPTVQAGQLIDIIVNYLRVNAARRHFDAAGLVAHALSDAFPCSRRQ
jgi:Rap1a immunity proteins